MNRFFIKHKLDIFDITHLSDSDSEFAINQLKVKVEDVVEIETYEAIYLAIVTDISKNSVEVEIREKISVKSKEDNFDITILQSLIGKNKFNVFLEKSVEIGIDRIIPVETQYSLINKNKALKEYGLWRKIVNDATEQSRNIKPTVIEKPINLKDLTINDIENRVCLCTENVQSQPLREYIQGVDIKKSFIIAIGPEKGWSSKDIQFFKALDFKFVKLEGNILRTETVGLVIGSIIKYLKGEI
ncbi:MAG: RsmE family RNA methyltransferase [Candidatus Dojkabacteria bacterium]|jgi:16S rRNA (uracil1498-N3)-methyltransferase|nr:RsmE family RNA methyltransferase [Candidatus Dojkabacteria bacterium]